MARNARTSLHARRCETRQAGGAELQQRETRVAGAALRDHRQLHGGARVNIRKLRRSDFRPLVAKKSWNDYNLAGFLVDKC